MPRRAWIALLACSLACTPEPEPSGDEADSTDASTDSGTETETTTDSSDESTTDTTDSTDSTTDTGEDPLLDAEDFACILDWPKVRRFRITNVLGDVDASLAVANSSEGGSYPVGTLIQLIPSEAMLKRAPGFAPQANDWEFFSLSVSADGTEILDRGSETVVNQFGGNCFNCHQKAEPQWDFVCEQDHGCDPLPLTEEQFEAVQNADPRCP